MIAKTSRRIQKTINTVIQPPVCLTAYYPRVASTDDGKVRKNKVTKVCFSSLFFVFVIFLSREKVLHENLQGVSSTRATQVLTGCDQSVSYESLSQHHTAIPCSMGSKFSVQKLRGLLSLHLHRLHRQLYYLTIYEPHFSPRFFSSQPQIDRAGVFFSSEVLAGAGLLCLRDGGSGIQSRCHSSPLPPPLVHRSCR